MKLVGRNLSPYARRVAIWCAMQGRDLEREILAVSDPRDMAAIAAYNPLVRVPVLVLDDGTVLMETSAICDYLDETGETRLVPASGPARWAAMQRIALAHSTTEKIVAIVYEKNRRPPEYTWPQWLERLTLQVHGGLDAIETSIGDGFLGGDAPDGSDIATVCAYQMAVITNPWLVEGRYPRLAALAERAMELAPFRDTHPDNS